MARTNIRSTRVRPRTTGAVGLEVLAREQISPHFIRVTLGRGNIESFVPLGHDQWVRLFFPQNGGNLAAVPSTLSLGSYARFLASARGDQRPVLRAYTIREYRSEGPDGPEIDIDFVVHGTGEAAGVASAWARNCVPGDEVAILDEGTGFTLPAGIAHVLLVADESGLPAAEGVLAALPAHVRGTALLEIPAEEDRRVLAAPRGISVRWLVREDPHAVPGVLARTIAADVPLPAEGFFGWVVGESALATGVRREWVSRGVPKDRIMFCGYWKVGRSG
ncbi:siderophore-interacting protein [Mycetocola saprophilus]|uniref:siderophore-interacting protein n=1 Tax=Mycetocola saprophilus TaxID=76636 RepID=UPI003BF3D263